MKLQLQRYQAWETGQGRDLVLRSSITNMYNFSLTDFFLLFYRLLCIAVVLIGMLVKQY